MSTRRNFMVGTAAGAAVLPFVAGQSRAGAASGDTRTLVVMFLRGGCDGLSVLSPVGESAYHDARPNVAVPESAALPLGSVAPDPTFGWHPAAPELSRFYDAGRVAVVPSAGTPDHSRSHFDCQDGMEAGRPEDRHSVSGGWLGRYLASTASGDHPLRAFSAATGLPPSMAGYGAISAQWLDQLGLVSWGPDPGLAMAAIGSGYTPERAGGDLAMWAGVTLDALDEVAPLLEGEVRPPDTWPDSYHADRLFTIARLIEEGMPVQVATVDMGGWDHHDDMGSATDTGARTHSHVRALDAAIGAFFDRLDAAGHGDHVTLVTMTEFGRRFAENDSGGLDHGFGSQMLMVGAGITPGVHGAWPGVGPSDLAGGDLAVTVDYRSVLSELLSRNMGAGDLSGVFPGFDTSPGNFVGVTS